MKTKENLYEFKICVKKASPRRGSGGFGLWWPRFRIQCFFNGSKLYDKVLAIFWTALAQNLPKLTWDLTKLADKEFESLNKIKKIK